MFAGQVLRGLGHLGSASADYPAETDVRDTVSYDTGNLTGNMTLPSVGQVRQNIQYGANGTEFTGTLQVGATFTVSASADPVNTLMSQIKADLRSANSAGELIDENTPVRNIWDSLDFTNATRSHLPLIQFDVIGAPVSTYIGDSFQSIPFSIQFICWIAKGNDGRKAITRARDLREKLINSLHNRKPFSSQGANRQTLSFTREREEYTLRFAQGAGLVVSGDLWDVAGS